MRFIKIVPPCVLILLLSLTFAYGQERPTGRVNIERVSVNLIVLDQNEKMIEDLAPEDVKIFEDDVEQTITSFRKRSKPSHVALLIDNSGSLRGRLNEIVKVARTILDNLDPQDEVMLIRFVSRDTIEIIVDWTTDREELRKALNELFVEGGKTALADVIYLALENISEKIKGGNDGAVILLTDGDERGSYHSGTEIAELLSGTNIPVHSFAIIGHLKGRLESEKPKPNEKTRSFNFLNDVALLSGGTSFFVEKCCQNKVLREYLEGLMLELGSQFVIKYIPGNQLRNGLMRRLRVEIADGPNGKKRRGIVRKDFTVPVTSLRD